MSKFKIISDIRVLAFNQHVRFFFVYVFFVCFLYINSVNVIIIMIKISYHIWDIAITSCVHYTCIYDYRFLAATKQLWEWLFPSVCLSVCLSVCPSVCLSVCLSVRLWHLFDNVPVIISSWKFQEVLPMTKVTSMQKVKVRGQWSRSQRSTPNLTVSGL